jgi:beta-glucosidase
LKGFEKVFIPAGESAEINISIQTDELRYYNSQDRKWILEAGTYIFMVGPSSAEGSLTNTRIDLS